MKRNIGEISDGKNCSSSDEHVAVEITDNHQIVDENILSGEPKSKKQIIQNYSPSAYYKLGCDYYDKKDDQDYVKALELFMKGAEEECAECQHKIGYIYHQGLGIEQDYAKAMEWYLKSAKVLSKSQCNIGSLYKLGNGVKKDITKAMEWYLKAADKNHIKAQFQIGSLYGNGEGVPQDHTKAIEWYIKAGNNTNGTATDLGIAQVNIGFCYSDGRGVPQDYTKAMEWYLKAAENNNAIAQYNVGICFENGEGVEKNYLKAMEWYLKAANNKDLDAKYNIADLYLKGNGVEKDERKAIFWVAESFNYDHVKLIEEPFKRFATEDITSSNEESATIMDDEMDQQVIIRFEERDFKIISKYLKVSKYLSAMLNSNWKDFNVKEENQIVLDLRSIQNDIFQEETSDHIQIFEIFVSYLTSDNNIIPKIDFDVKVKLIEMARYLGDDQCILNVLLQETLLMRFYILQKLEIIEPLHIAIASCFAGGSSLTITDLAENITESILNQSEISSLAKKKMLKAFEKKFKKFPTTINFNNKILHVILSNNGNKKELNFNNQEITFTLESCEDDEKRICKINSSLNLEFFGSNAKFYIQLTINDAEEDLGIWLENCNPKTKTIFILPRISNNEDPNSSIQLIVIT